MRATVWIVVLLAGSLSVAYSQDLAQQVCSAKNNYFEYNINNANAIMGVSAIMRNAGAGGLGCGTPNAATMQWFEAIKYTVNYLNNFNGGQGYLPNVKFGFKLHDSCYSTINGVRTLQKLFPQTTSYSPYCQAASSPKVMLGLVGAFFSTMSIGMADYAKEIPATMVSPSSMSTLLSNKAKYPTFFRTVSSTAVQMRAIASLSKKLNWQKLAVLYSEGSYGSNSYQQLVSISRELDICVSYAVAMPLSGSVSDYVTILRKIGSNDFKAGVISAANGQARMILQAIQQVPEVQQIQWILIDVDMNSPVTNQQMRGALTVMPRSYLIEEFRDYFVRLEQNPRTVSDNPWFKEWYEEVYSCSLDAGNPNPCPPQTQATLSNNFRQSAYVLPTIKAVLAYAEALKALCPSGTGLCQAAQTATSEDIQNALQNMDFTFPANFMDSDLVNEKINFDLNREFSDMAFSVFQFNDVAGAYSFQELGVYQNGQLDLNAAPKFYDQARNTALVQAPTATCDIAGCNSCIMPPTQVSYKYTPGNIVIASLVNSRGTSSSPFTCGPYTVKGLASMAAVKFAVEYYKTTNPGKLQGVSLGALTADVCPSGAEAVGFLNDLLGSTSSVVDDMGVAISSRSKIIGFVDDTGNTMAKAITPILNQYGLPEIQVGATDIAMQAGDMYPYFASAMPSQDVFLKALTNLLQAKGWKHVQIATTKDNKYMKMAAEFRAYAARQGICVVRTTYLDDGAPTVLNQLMNNPQAFVVVTFGDADSIKALFAEIKTKSLSLSRNGLIQVVSGMPEWGTDPRYFDATNSAPDYTITLGLVEQSNSAFSSYLLQKGLDEIKSNTYLASLYEMSNQCSLRSSTGNLYSRRCGAENFSPYQGNAPLLIQAILNMADSLHEVITEVCGDANYNGLCVEFQRSTDISQRLAAKLKNSEGIVNGKANSNIGYYVINNGAYQQFGQYSVKDQSLVSLNGAGASSLNPSFNSGTSCDGVCVECQYLFTYKDVIYRPGDFVVAGAFSMSSSGPAGLQPYVCGDVKMKNGPLYSTAMMFALEQVNLKKAPVSVNGITIGGLALDHCSNSGRQNLMVSDIYSGFLHPVMDVDEANILSWVVDSSTASKETAELLDPLNVPIVSPSATAEFLMKDYETFFRTIQGDATSASAFVKIAKMLGFPYIQVVHEASDYGRGAKDTLVSVAMSEGVCVSSSIEMSDISEASSIVSQVVSKETQVVVLIMGTSNTEAMFEAISFNSAATSSLVVMLPEPYTSIVNTYGSRMKYQPISLQLETSSLNSYMEYLKSNPVDNVFFARLYMTMFQCNVEGYYMYTSKCVYPLQPITNSPRFDLSLFSQATINSVYASVDALDRTLKDYCGAAYTAPCSAFYDASDRRQQYIKNLQLASFIDEGPGTFHFLQREGDVSYGVLQFNKAQNSHVKVGTYGGVALTLGGSFVNSYKEVQSVCSAPCLECLNLGLNFSLTTGDIYLAGLFDVHQPGRDPFTCGRINTLHGFLLLEAFHYALDQVNSKEGQFKNILNGVKLGGVGLDACSSQVRGGQLVSNINNDLSVLTKGGVTVTAPMIDTYIGSYSSGSSRYLARILTDLMIPQISYAAGSTDLSDTRVYPYFYRTVPSNVNQAKAILAYLNENSIRYIQILSTDNSYGRSGRDELVKLAAEYKICVAQTVDYDDRALASLEIAKTAVSTLLEKPAANTVVTFMETDYINTVLKAVAASDRARNKLRFVGSDTWADNLDAISQAEEYAVDSVTLKLDSDDLQGFESYMNSKKLSNSGGNPWFEEYYQEIHNCYTSRVNPYSYPRACSQSLSSIISSVRYQQDPSVAFVVNAVYASAFAVDKTLTQLCGVGYQAVCQAYRNSLQRRDAIRDNLASVQFQEEEQGQRTFRFKDREGEINYRLNAIVPGDIGGVVYKQIGMYNTSDKSLQLTNGYQPSIPWRSDCDRKDACAECPNIRNPTTRYTFYSSPNAASDSPVMVAFFDIHQQGVDPYRCGPLNMAGFQQFLAYFYSMQDLFNQHIQGSVDSIGVLRGIRVLVVDTCSNPVRLDQDLFGLLQGTGLCNTLFTPPPGVSISSGNIGSVLASGDQNTMAAGRLLEQLGITYISPNAKSPLLDYKKNLARTVAPVSAQMKFLSAALKNLGWNYVDVIYEESAKGYYPYKQFSHFSAVQGLCVGSPPIVVGEGTDDKDLQDFMARLNGNRGSRVVVVFGGQEMMRRVLVAAYTADIVEDYVWVLAGDMALEAIGAVVPANADVRIMAFHRLSLPVVGFKNYIGSLQADNSLNNRNIPKGWFEEFFQTMNDCTMSGADKPLNLGKPECSGSISTSQFVPDEYILNTVAAAFAGSKGLYEFIKDDPGRAAGSQLNTANNRNEIREQILKASKNLNLNGIVNHDLMFQFNQDRWWESGYVLNYWAVRKKNPSKQWMRTLYSLPMSDDDLDSFRDVSNTSSMCLETLEEGFCGCDIDQIMTAEFVGSDMNSDGKLRNYYKYDDGGDRVFEWPLWAVVVAVLTGIGLFVTLILFLILLIAYPKKGGTSVLGYLMIVGVLGIYAVNFAFFMNATDDTCLVRRLVMGVVYVICFAPMLIKAMDNWRYGHIDYNERRYSGINSCCALLMSALGIVAIQCIIPIMWLILVNPTSTHGQGLHDNSWCDPTGDYDLGLVLSFSFVVFIVVLTAIFAALGYDSNTNNNESRWILFGAVATAGCFLVWMVVTTNAGPVYRDPAVAIANCVNASILMLVIPFRKTVLLCQSKMNRDKEEEPVSNGNPYDMYEESYANPGYELSDYDYGEKHPSEF